jgi:hypothetical protein
LGVVDAEAGFAEFGDEDEGVGGGVGVGGEDGGFVVAGPIGGGDGHIGGGVGAAGEDVEDGTFGENGEGGAGGRVGADPAEGDVEGLGVVAGGEDGGIVDGMGDIPLAADDRLQIEERRREAEEQGGGDGGADRGTGRAERKEDGAAESGEGQDEPIVPNMGIEEHLGHEEEGENGEGKDERGVGSEE